MKTKIKLGIIGFITFILGTTGYFSTQLQDVPIIGTLGNIVRTIATFDTKQFGFELPDLGFDKVIDGVNNITDQLNPKNPMDSTKQLITDASDETPSEDLSRSVITPSVQEQLANESLTYDAGSFVIGDGLTDLDASVSSQPYVQLTNKNVNGQTIATTANALLKKSSRQYRSRTKTGNDSSDWTPAGWHQVSNLNGPHQYAVNRGHLIGYALAGSIKGFDASESNPDNIVTQTAWSNQARAEDSKGQNYYEGIIRKALDQNKTVRYRVTPIYSTPIDLVPSGNRLEARSSDDTINFDVFIPNVQSGISLNYETGEVTVHN